MCIVKMGNLDAKIEEVHTCYEKSCYKLYSLNFGVPHAVIFSDELNNEHLGKYLEQCELFPNHANIDFMMIKNNQIYMHTYERGVGFTLACGTGACSCFVVCHRMGLIKDEVFVNLPGGRLKIYTMDNFIYMEGPAEKVGMVEIEC